MTDTLFSSLFLAVLVATAAFKLWLGYRHQKHVAQHRSEVPREFAQQISLGAHHKAADYTLARLGLGRIDLLINAAWVLILTLGGGLQWLHTTWAGVFTEGSLLHGTAFLASIGVLGALIDLPLTLYRTFVTEARFGFNKITPALFIADTAKSTALAALIGLPVVAAVLWLMTAMGAHWWWAVWLFWLGFNLLVLLVWPTFIAPLFNRFTPLEDERMRGRIDALLARCGFRSNGLFVMDGSRRSAHGNAYFTGFGQSKRIVFFDTLLNTLEPIEVEAVLAHELGHFKHRHVTKRLVLMSAMMLGLLWLLSALIAAPWFFAGLGVTAQSTAMALALFMIALPVFSFPFSPLMSAWSRKHEFEADRYATQQSSGEALVSALVKLYRDNASTLTPDPLYSRIYDSHPPASIRIAHLQGKTL
ncbi:MAG TPA: M48 family metallopeptidase [Denitromonas sp.]|uniref:M48 family metallopeptidase n=1 Tax=Denitromonas sp. TaxID=2734609 RepID=UPI001D6688BD|nr:M48 family metallopeptidase [Rhodocyclaceae bacterium]MCP5220902.1 M48 family metallopeptidase [Zoogloeaceae bacterium]HQU87206.1 M48 family metallopeptidase [Denitromonas sp.]HQV13529.1 M48 family metallopeptidase [Denitromonas sp.]